MDPKLTEVSQLFDRFKAAMMWNVFDTCTKLLSQLKGVVLFICISIFIGSVLALGAIVSAKPLDKLGYKGWNGDQNSVTSPYASSVYLGWAMACVVALIVTEVLPIVSWFATYGFSICSAICVGIFAVAFCGASYLEVVNFRDDQVPRKADFLAVLLPLMCIPALRNQAILNFKSASANIVEMQMCLMWNELGLL